MIWAILMIAILVIFFVIGIVLAWYGYNRACRSEGTRKVYW